MGSLHNINKLFLVFVKKAKKTKENFRSNLRSNKYKEHFTNNSIRDIHVDTEDESENNEETTNNGEVVKIRIMVKLKM